MIQLWQVQAGRVGVEIGSLGARSTTSEKVAETSNPLRGPHSHYHTALVFSDRPLITK
jgi:hypothetical protein